MCLRSKRKNVLRGRGGLMRKTWLSVVWLFQAKVFLECYGHFWTLGSHRSIDELEVIQDTSVVKNVSMVPPPRELR